MAISVKHASTLSGSVDNGTSPVSKNGWLADHVVSGLLPEPNGIQNFAGLTAYKMCGNALNGFSNATAALTANREHWFPWFQTFDISVTRAMIDVTAGVASTGLKVAFYAVGSNGAPTTLVGDLNSANPFSTAAAGVITVSATTDFTGFTLPAGWYWVRYISNGAITIRVSVNPTKAQFAGLLGSTSGNLSPPAVLYRGGDYSYVPADNPTLTSMSVDSGSSLYYLILAIGG